MDFFDNISLNAGDKIHVPTRTTRWKVLLVPTKFLIGFALYECTIIISMKMAPAAIKLAYCREWIELTKEIKTAPYIFRIKAARL